jgi:hypothetical protein
MKCDASWCKAKVSIGNTYGVQEDTKNPILTKRTKTKFKLSNQESNTPIACGPLASENLIPTKSKPMKAICQVIVNPLPP